VLLHNSHSVVKMVKMLLLGSYWKCIIWVLENPGIWHFSALESHGRKCCSFCTQLINGACCYTALPFFLSSDCDEMVYSCVHLVYNSVHQVCICARHQFTWDHLWAIYLDQDQCATAKPNHHSEVLLLDWLGSLVSYIPDLSYLSWP